MTSIATHFWDEECARVRTRLDSHGFGNGVFATYLLREAPRIWDILGNRLQQVGATVRLAAPTRCPQCGARVEPPANGDRFLWCLGTCGVVADGPFGPYWIVR
jgi:hypothetical protein